ncbi:MAG: type II toxin-antitoxin system VapC family toxin [Kiritimatiellia bacterium]
MIYFDTSYIAKCYLNEPHADKVRQLAMRSDGLACSYLGRVEFWSVLNRHVREGRIASKQAQAIRRVFVEDEVNDVWHWFPVTSDLMMKVCGALEHLPLDLFVRSADAIHLVSATEHGLNQIYSSDTHLLRCAACFGLRGCNVIP